MADGAVMDGPEWGYEIAPHHMNYRSYFFNDLPESVAPMAKDLGYDYQAMVAARDRLLHLFHNLDSRRIRTHARGGIVGAHRMLGADPDLMAWLSFRVDSVTRYFRRIREGVAAELGRPVRMGCGPRSAAFAPLCGYDFVELAQFMDFLLPKHYFFHRGFDGFVGTVYRYSQTLIEWNPGLTVPDTLEIVQSLFGIVLPGVQDMLDFESALTPEFFEAVVKQETRRAIASVDDPERIVPWLDTGRFPHDGDPMTARDLKMLLDAAEEAGLPMLPGAATSSEVMALLERGYTVQKFFPAEANGGAPALKAIGAPLPQVRFCPTGGVSLRNAPEYLGLPNTLCVGGSWVAPKDKVASGDWDGITALAREASRLG